MNRIIIPVLATAAVLIINVAAAEDNILLKDEKAKITKIQEETLKRLSLVSRKDAGSDEQKTVQKISNETMEEPSKVNEEAVIHPKWTEEEFRFIQEKNKMIILVGLMIMTIISLILVLICLHRTEACTAINIVNGTGLVLIIFATIFVVMIADVDQQLTAAIGIIGAIAGYLFGSLTRRETQNIP